MDIAIFALPQAHANLEFWQPEAIALNGHGFIATRDQGEGLPVIGIAIEDDVVGNPQNILIHLPFGGGLISGGDRLAQVFGFGAGGEEFYHNGGTDPFLPKHVAEAEIGLFVEAGDAEGSKPVGAFVPKGMAGVVIEVEVSGSENAIFGVVGKAKGFAQQLGL